MGLFLAPSVSRHHGNVAAISQPLSLGRVRSRDLFYRLDPVLVFGFGAGFGDHSRSRAQSVAEKTLWIPRTRLAQLGRSLAASSNRLLAPGWAGDAACPFG